MQTRSYFFNLILQGERKMYSSYLTRETFENEHDEKMTRKFSYNYQVLKRLFPEVYKLPESEIRSLVHSIYDNPKMGDELLDHLSDVINKKKPEWGEYLNPKPEEPEQTVQPVQQDNPLQPVQPKPLNTGSGFEPYKPQKSAFGLNNTGDLNGFNNSNSFGQTKLPNFSKGMDLKHSDMVTGFGINEAKQNSMLGTGFSMPKLPKMPQFPKAPEPQTPDFQSAQQLNNARLQNYYNRPFTSYIPWGEVGQAAKDGMAIAANTLRYAPEGFGEALADAHIAYKYWKEMNQTGDKLVRQYGSGAGADIDNYYHPLLQCQLAKISPESRDYGLRLGYAKEIYDYNKKKSIMPMDILVDDMRKDLYNNLYGNNIGYYNQDRPCWELLDEKRTENMRKANIR